MTTDLWVFLGLALIAVASAVSMLVSRNAVYSALFLVLNFVAVAVLYLLLNAAFIALVQVTVYAGAIMVLFLFVIMLLGAERVETGRSLRWQQPAAVAPGGGAAGGAGLRVPRRGGCRPGARGASRQRLRQPDSGGAPALLRVSASLRGDVDLAPGGDGRGHCSGPRGAAGSSGGTMNIPTDYLLALSAVLFGLGILGVLMRRNAIVVFMSVELMLNAANLALIAFARQAQDMIGHVLVFFVIAVAAAEVSVGLALIVTIFKAKHSIDIDQVSGLRG